MTLLNFSIPSLMPIITIRVVTRRKPVWTARGAHVEDTISMNMVLNALLDDSPVNENVRDFRR